MNQIELDWQRSQRTGLSEAIFCQGKSYQQLVTIFKLALAKKQALLLTRLQEEQLQSIPASYRQHIDYDGLSRTGFFYAQVLPMAAYNRETRIAIVSAGSSDVGVALEAVRTLNFFQQSCEEFYDIGVAGLWRLQQQLPHLREQHIIICLAGMDAALPTVLAGLLPIPIIAVPTSIGYGSAENGRTALNALLCSCAPGLVVVNIDNGYGAACAALRALRLRSQ